MLVQVGKRFVSEQRDIDLDFAKGMKTLLSKSKVFTDCHDEFIRDLIVSSNRKEYAPNRYLMEEGARGDAMFVLYRGVVEVTANGRYICKLRDGSIVGEAALLNIDNRRTASVRSVQKCDVAIIFRSTFHSILEKYPWEKRKFQREMKSKLMELGKLIDIKEDINLEQQAIQCDALKKVPFFASSETLHEFVAELAMEGVSHWYRPGKVIIQEGDTRCDEMYVLLRGAVEVTACGQFLGRLENDLFGEIGVLDLLERRTANVVAATQCHCMMFTRQMVIPVLAKYPDARMKLLEHARLRLMLLNEAIGKEETQFAARAITNGGGGGGASVPDLQMIAASKLLRDARPDLIAELSHRFASKKFDEGKTILEEGQGYRPDRDSIFFIAKGKVEVSRNGNFIQELGEAETFGDLVAFSKTDRSTGGQPMTVVCRTKVVLRVISVMSMMDLRQKYPDQELLSRWQTQTEARFDMLKAKEELQASLRFKTVPLDLMFMKLPVLREDGTRAPRTQPLSEALADSVCFAAKWGEGPSNAQLALTDGRRKLAALGALSAR